MKLNKSFKQIIFIPVLLAAAASGAAIATPMLTNQISGVGKPNTEGYANTVPFICIADHPPLAWGQTIAITPATPPASQYYIGGAVGWVDAMKT